MPYINEYSRHKTLKTIIENDQIKSFVKKLKIKKIEHQELDDIDEIVVDKETLEQQKNEYKTVSAIDGSNCDVSLEIGLPGSNLSIIKITQTLVDIVEMVSYEETNIANPLRYEDIYRNYEYEIVIPTYNVINEDHESSKDMFRYVLYDFLRGTENRYCLEKISTKEEAVTLLDTYKILLSIGEENISTFSPCEVCASNGINIDTSSFLINEELHDTIKCKCSTNSKTIYISDLCKIHEYYNENGQNVSVSTQLMSVLEKLILINFIQNIAKIYQGDEFENYISKTLMVMDGPLAIYSEASWISDRITKFLSSRELKSVSVVGVEKSGNFYDHFCYIDEQRNAKGKPLSDGMVFYLNDRYIKKYIKYSNGVLPYGARQYFGKKLLYKNHSGNKFVINHLFKNINDRDNLYNNRTGLNYFKEQHNIIKILYIFDRFDSLRYKDALSFISMAHENISISNGNFARRAIKGFIKEQISENIVRNAK